MPSRFFAEAKGENPAYNANSLRSTGYNSYRERYNDEYESAIPSAIDFSDKSFTPIKKAELAPKPKKPKKPKKQKAPGPAAENQ